MRFNDGFLLFGLIVMCSVIQPARSDDEPGQSGLRGTTRSEVVSGPVPGKRGGGLCSLEFAIAPMVADQPDFKHAVFVKSKSDGSFEIALKPGKYWIGPKARALNAGPAREGPLVMREFLAEVKAGAFTTIELRQVGYAP